jgi:peroxin-6
MSLLCSRRSVPRTFQGVLSEVILDALSDVAYRFALDSPELVEQALTSPNAHLHLGSLHDIPSDQFQDGFASHSPLQYRTLMLEPTSHGIVDPQLTKIIVVRSGDLGSLTSPNIFSEHAESDSIEIDESFLENAVAPKALKLNGHIGNDHLDTSSTDTGHSLQVLFNAEPLASPASPLDDHCTLYIRTADLGRVGLLNEDWVCVITPFPLNILHPTIFQAIASSDTENNYRLVRIVAEDNLVKQLYVPDILQLSRPKFSSSGTICGSPVLLSNILGSSQWNTTDDQTPRISLRPSPFGQRQPAIPTAKSVTIARIASPYSIHKKYQTASLNSLKSYFAATKRLVKANDVIALSLYTKPKSSLYDGDGGSEHEDDRCV